MSSTRFRTIMVVLALAAFGGVAAMPAAAAEPAPGESGAFIEGTDSTCFFNYGAFGQTENARGEKAFNIAYPDAHAVYWAAYFRRPAGSTLLLHGEYPHARYMSLVTYNAAGAILDGVNDEMINPNIGSVNPFRSGEPLGATNRSYTVEVKAEKRPASLPTSHLAEEPARNYVYAYAPANEETAPSGKYNTELVVLRVYVPDKGQPITGGVPLPEPELKLSNGEVLTGQALCNATDAQSRTRHEEGLPTRISEPSSLLLNKEIWHALSKPQELKEACNVAAQQVATCPLPKNPFVSSELIQTPKTVEDPAAYPAKETEVWRGQFTRKYLLQTWTGDSAQGAESNPVKEGGGGFFPNIDNNYERDVLSRTFGKVVVATGKLPTSPETYENTGNWPNTKEVQDRYTSYCMNESPRSTKVMDCLYDEEIPTNENREFTIAISRSGDRPKDAVPFCGVAWMGWSTEGDGEEAPYTNEEFGVLQMRTMLPNKTFTHAAQDVLKIGTDKSVMGEYLPTVHYEPEAASFEASHGCGWSDPGTPHLSSGSTPNTGAFTLSWTPNPHAAKVSGVTYTLEHESHAGVWSVLASDLTSPEYTATAEAEGTWAYRVKASGEGAESGVSGESAAVKVARTGPRAPTAAATSSPAYAGDGGWYAGSAEVTFTPNGVGALADGSEGAAVNVLSLSSPVLVSTSGSHTVCGTVADVLGNVSPEGCTTVQVDATPPSVTVTCPATAVLGSSGVSASVSASDSYSGLKTNPSGVVPISTATVGDVTVSRSAESNVGTVGSGSCTTDVVYGFAFRPTGWPAGKEFYPGYGVRVAFLLSNSKGQKQTGASATIEVAKVTGGVVGSYSPGTPQNSSYTGDQFKASGAKGQLAYDLKDAGFSPGTWDLRISLSDGSTHVVSITIV